MATVHHSAEHKRQLAEIKRTRPQPCALCGGLIDYLAKSPHPDSPSVEHLIPVTMGGANGPIAAAHLGCNRTQGGMIRAGKAQTFEQYTSGVW